MSSIVTTNHGQTAVVRVLNGPGGRGSRPLPPAIAKVLNDLSDSPDQWTELDYSQFHQQSPDAARDRIMEMLKRRRITGFRFGVFQGVLHGRKEWGPEA